MQQKNKKLSKHVPPLIVALLAESHVSNATGKHLRNTAEPRYNKVDENSRRVRYIGNFVISRHAEACGDYASFFLFTSSLYPEFRYTGRRYI